MLGTGNVLNPTLENLSHNLQIILYEKTKNRILIFSLLDMVIFLILTTLTEVCLLPIGLHNLVTMYAVNKRNTRFLNIGFILGFSSIPFKIIITIYHKTTLTILLCLLNCLTSIINMTYLCKTLGLLGQQLREFELIPKIKVMNPYFSKRSDDLNHKYMETNSNSSDSSGDINDDAILESDL